MLCAAEMRAQHSTSPLLRGTIPGAGLLIGILVAALFALSGAPAARGSSLSSVEPLTPWHKPLVVLPRPRTLNLLGLAQQGVSKAASWRHDGWFCEYLGCDNGPYPLLTIWGEVPMFETADALQLAQPSGSHRRLVEKFVLASERYWDRALGGYAPYPGDREPNVEAFFDDNGWLGIAFAEAYAADHEQRWLRDAQRAFRFISTKGWDTAGGGGMWWHTDHPH